MRGVVDADGTVRVLNTSPAAANFDDMLQPSLQGLIIGTRTHCKSITPAAISHFTPKWSSCLSSVGSPSRCSIVATAAAYIRADSPHTLSPPCPPTDATTLLTFVPNNFRTPLVVRARDNPYHDREHAKNANPGGTKDAGKIHQDKKDQYDYQQER